MTTFALVHGGWHGAWCWDRLVPELAALGHRAVAMDLPCDDATATFDTYADVVVDAVADDADVVVVGHSLAGHTIPLVAARRPVRALVYLCALVPTPGSSFIDQFRKEPDMLFRDYERGLAEPDAQRRRRWVDEDLARRTFYEDCDEALASTAFSRLRPQATTPYSRPCPLDALPSAPATYIVCDDDRMVNPEWSRRVAEDRLHARLVELSGGHSPFLSRPAELASILHNCTLGG